LLLVSDAVWRRVASGPVGAQGDPRQAPDAGTHATLHAVSANACPQWAERVPVVCEAGRVTSAAGGQKVRVVVGDDHPLFRDGVVRALNSSGSIDVVAEADDGVAALALIREHGPQVALLDYRMPGLDGAQVAAAVKRDELPTRVLLISAHDESAIVYSALQEGAAGFTPRSPATPSWWTRC
jgi:two-component system nitrate/nitrite response regulator NarL